MTLLTFGKKHIQSGHLAAILNLGNFVIFT